MKQFILNYSLCLVGLTLMFIAIYLANGIYETGVYIAMSFVFINGLFEKASEDKKEEVKENN